MSSTLQNAGSMLTGFFTWWGAELAGLLPRVLTSGGRSIEPNRIISIDDGGWRVIGPTGALSDDLMTLAELTELLVGDKNRAALRIGLRLPYRACFSRRVELPTAAARDFPRLLALDLERATPFKPRDVRTAYFAEADQRTPGKTALRQLVAKRSSLDGTIAALQEAGLTVTQADCWSADGETALPINFLDVASGTNPRGGWFWPTALAASACGLVAFAGHTVLERHETALAAIRSETAKLKGIVDKQRNDDAEVRARLAEGRNFAQVLASAPSKAVALEELTRLLPDHARVTDLKLEGLAVDISGVAQSAVGLLPILEKSTVFVNAEQTAPVMADAREGKDRFSIRVRIRNAGGGQ